MSPVLRHQLVRIAGYKVRATNANASRIKVGYIGGADRNRSLAFKVIHLKNTSFFLMIGSREHTEHGPRGQVKRRVGGQKRNDGKNKKELRINTISSKHHPNFKIQNSLAARILPFP